MECLARYQGPAMLRYARPVGLFRGRGPFLTAYPDRIPPLLSRGRDTPPPGLFDGPGEPWAIALFRLEYNGQGVMCTRGRVFPSASTPILLPRQHSDITYYILYDLLNHTTTYSGYTISCGSYCIIVLYIVLLLYYYRAISILYGFVLILYTLPG